MYKGNSKNPDSLNKKSICQILERYKIGYWRILPTHSNPAIARLICVFTWQLCSLILGCLFFDVRKIITIFVHTYTWNTHMIRWLMSDIFGVDLGKSILYIYICVCVCAMCVYIIIYTASDILKWGIRTTHHVFPYCAFQQQWASEVDAPKRHTLPQIERNTSEPGCSGTTARPECVVTCGNHDATESYTYVHISDAMMIVTRPTKEMGTPSITSIHKIETFGNWDSLCWMPGQDAQCQKRSCCRSKGGLAAFALWLSFTDAEESANECDWSPPNWCSKPEYLGNLWGLLNYPTMPNIFTSSKVKLWKYVCENHISEESSTDTCTSLRLWNRVRDASENPSPY